MVNTGALIIMNIEKIFLGISYFEKHQNILDLDF